MVQFQRLVRFSPGFPRDGRAGAIAAKRLGPWKCGNKTLITVKADEGWPASVRDTGAWTKLKLSIRQRKVVQEV
jgi:hypothetical protein